MSSLVEDFKQSLKNWWAYELLGAILVLMGILVFAYPAASYVGLVVYFAITFFISGILRIVTSISNRDVLKNWILYAIGGLVDLGLGVLLMGNLGLTAIALSYYVGFFVMFASFTAMVKSFDLKHAKVEGWGLMLTVGIIGLFLSVILLGNPVIGAGSIVLCTALGFISMGVFYISAGMKLRKVSGYVSDRFPGVRA